MSEQLQQSSPSQLSPSEQNSCLPYSMLRLPHPGLLHNGDRGDGDNDWVEVVETLPYGAIDVGHRLRQVLNVESW